MIECEIDFLIFYKSKLYFFNKKYFSIYYLENLFKYLSLMFKIKSHYRNKSQDHLFYTKDKSDEIKESFFVKENLKNTKNTPEKSPQIIPKINNL